jgi:hypothetical protein
VHSRWRLFGTYLESCNCAAICPCRRIGGVAGGRSTYGICLGALSWRVEQGRVGETDAAGLNVALASRYSDDEPGSPWDYVLYVDERGSAAQQSALTDVFTGRLGGAALDHFPWAWKPSRLLAVRPARIELEHVAARRWLRVDERVTVRIRERLERQPEVTCVIPGHHQDGEELVAEQLRVADELLDFEFEGNCAYGAAFDYSG